MPFDYEQCVEVFRSRKGDQFLLPGGTRTPQGRNQVVLENPGRARSGLTFKMYDYLRLDLDRIRGPFTPCTAGRS